MAKPRSLFKAQGFSLVELLVALVFTGVLMAGMASVFKASLSAFYTSGEMLSSARRNRMSIDLLGDDLNTACMYLVELSVLPTVVASNPPFYILPNMPVTGALAGETSDELYFYMDQPLPFDGDLIDPRPAPTAVNAAPTVTDNTFVVECGDSSYANQVKSGQVFMFKDSWETAYINAAPTVGGTTVTVVAGPDPMAGVTGTGSNGIPRNWHLLHSGIVFIQPAQMVRYRVVMLRLDPDPLKPNGIPCLVREQVAYGAAFDATTPQQIITENVSKFKVYLSSNGQAWAGEGLAQSVTGFTAGWDAATGIRGLLDTQLATYGRPGFTSTRGLKEAGEHWFRSIPVMVRADVTTRTTTKRTEYVDPVKFPGNPAPYKELTQSLVFVPRHSGLTMN